MVAKRTGSTRRHPTLSRVVLLTLALVAGCAAQSRLVNLWKDPLYPKAPLRSLLVVTIKKDEVQRRISEDAVSEALTRAGVEATPSYRLFAAAAPDTQQVRDAVASQGLNGVVVVHKLPTEVASRTVPGYMTSMPVAQQSYWSGTYYTQFRQVYQPGYTETESVVRYQVDVWSTDEGGTLVWTGTTESFNPASRADVTRHLTDLVIPELQSKGVIPPAHQ